MLLVTLVNDMAKAAELKTEAELKASNCLLSHTSICLSSFQSNLYCLKAEITSVLRRMYGEDVPEPEAIHCTKWAIDPQALGSFHSIRTGTTSTDLENLSRGIRNLQFAGTVL